MTISKSAIAIGLVSAGLAVALGGCQSGTDSSSSSGNSEPAATSSSARTAPAATKPTAEAMQAGTEDSPGKPVAPIRIDYEILGEPRPGEPLELQLKVESALEGAAVVRLQPQQGLQMGPGQATELRRDSRDTLAEPMAERIVVVPGGEGRFYLSVLVSVATPEGEQMRAVSVPIQVGDKPPVLQPGGELRTTEGETVISVPAKESESD